MDKQKLLDLVNSLVESGKIPQGIEIDIFASIASTNEKLWELIADKASLPRVAIALTQTSGRGQWGRVWSSPPGGLYLSLALSTDMSSHQAPHLTYSVAWGLASCLRFLLNLPILIKWPNDLVWQKRKLGGIKIETKVYQEKITQVVIGVGINYTNSVPPTGINLISVADGISLEELATVTIQGIFHGLDYYQSRGIESLLSAYLELFDNLGQSVTVGNLSGVVSGVNEVGQLGVRLYSPGASVEIFLEPGIISLGYYE